MPTRVWVVFGPEWRTTIEALRQVDDQLPNWLRDQMREAVEPVAQRAKAEVQSVGIQGGPAGHTGLRQRVATGVGIRAGVGRNPYLRVYTSMPERDEAIIPRGFDQAEGWRHPLFGDKRHWFRSVPTSTGWFTETLADGREEVQRALEEALERAASVIDAAS